MSDILERETVMKELTTSMNVFNLLFYWITESWKYMVAFSINYSFSETRCSLAMTSKNGCLKFRLNLYLGV